MANIKEKKLVNVISEFVVSGTDYNLGNISLANIIFLAKKDKENFYEIPKADYEILGEDTSNKILRIEQEYLKDKVKIQIIENYQLKSSAYITDLPNINNLKEHYNSLVADFTFLSSIIKQRYAYSDTKDQSLLFPELKVNESWIKTESGFRAFNLEISFDNEVANAIKEINDFLYLKEKEFAGILENYLILAQSGGNASFLQGHVPRNFSRTEATMNDLYYSAVNKYVVGDVVELAGYHTSGDGGNHTRKISASDDGSGVRLVSGLWANVLHDGEVDVRWFGLKANDLSAIDSNSRALEKILNNNLIAFFPKGTWYVRNLVLNKNIITIKGITEEPAYIDRVNHSILHTNKSDFISTYATGEFCVNATGVIFESGGQYVGKCFYRAGTGGEFTSHFHKVGIRGFYYGFYTGGYSSSSALEIFSARFCFYGWYAGQNANNSTAHKIDLIHNAFGISMWGLQTKISVVHCGGGNLPEDLVGSLEYLFQVCGSNVDAVYVEGYGGTVRTNMYIIAVPKLGGGYGQKFSNIAFPRSGDFANAGHVLFLGKYVGYNQSISCDLIIDSCSSPPLPNKLKTALGYAFIPNIKSEEYIDGTNPIDYGISLYKTVLPQGTGNFELTFEPTDFKQTILNIGLDDVDYSIYDKNSKRLRVQEAGFYSLTVEFTDITHIDGTIQVLVREADGSENYTPVKLNTITGNNRTTGTLFFSHYGFNSVNMMIEGTTRVATSKARVILRRISRIKNPQ